MLLVGCASAANRVPIVEIRPVTAAPVVAPLVTLSRRPDFHEAWAEAEFFFDGGPPDMDRKESLLRAEAAYRGVIASIGPQHKWWIAAHYKLAWTLFRSERYPEALEVFAIVATSNDAELRREAIQYMAVMAAEPDWNRDDLPDDRWGLDRNEVSAWTVLEASFAPDVLEELGRIFLDETRYDLAIETYELLLRRWPNFPRADLVRQQIDKARKRRP